METNIRIKSIVEYLITRKKTLFDPFCFR